MDLSRLLHLSPYARSRVRDPAADASERARIQNLQMEERCPSSGIDLYASYFSNGMVSNIDEWNTRHNDFASAELEIDQTDTQVPWTFRPENLSNRLPEIDQRINLVRIEDARWPCSLAGHSFEIVRAHIAARGGADSAASMAADSFLTRFAATWNAQRDKRPLFATTELEVEDLLQISSPTWVEKLRDRLGLGQYSPGAGAPPVPIFVMRYPLEDVYAAHGANGAPAVPTMLDGKLNDCFFPSPTPGPKSDQSPCLGHSLNLTFVTAENDYKLGVELLHGRVDYQPEHFYGTGIVANPVNMSIDRARKFHLPWLRLYRDRDDYGVGIFD